MFKERLLEADPRSQGQGARGVPGTMLQAVLPARASAAPRAPA